MRVVIDMQGAQTESRFRGIGRYSLSLAKAILINAKDNEIILALSNLLPESIQSIRSTFYNLLPQDNIVVWDAPGPVRECEPGNDPRRKVAEIIREAFIANLNPDIVLVPNLFEGFVDDAVTSIGVYDSDITTFVVIHDLIPMLYPDQYFKNNKRYQNYYHNKIAYLKKADFWLANSDSTSMEAKNELFLTSDFIINISAGVDKIFQPIKNESGSVNYGYLSSLEINLPFLLYTGGADSRKNLRRLIEAFAILPIDLRETHQLVLTGKIPEGETRLLYQTAKAVGVYKNQLLITGYVSDDQLVYLYNHCKLFILPSLHEGFGLPLLEAMACGAPVIGSNISSIPEVIGNPEALFDPRSVDSISQKIQQALQNEPFRQSLKEHSIYQAKKFSWNKSSKKAIKAFDLSKHADKTRKFYSRNITSYEKLISKISEITGRYSDRDLISIAECLAQNYSFGENRRLFVDISELIQRDAATGVQRVVKSHLMQLLQKPPQGFSVEPVYATLDSHYKYVRNFMVNMKDYAADELENNFIRWQRGDIFFALDMQHHVQLKHKKFYKQLQLDGVNVLFLIHDLLPIQLDDLFDDPKAKKLHENWLRMIAETNGAICVSKATADAYKLWIEENNVETSNYFQISWVHNGADIENTFPTKGMPDNSIDILYLVREKPTFLSVGTLEPRKCQSQILNAFELLWQQNIDLNLVFVGKEGWKTEKLINKIINHTEKNKRLFWLEGISDEYLSHIYNASTCLIAASVNEGFGLPLVEAVYYNKPIIARNIPVFKEIAREFAYYFSGLEPESLASAIKKWLALYENRNHPQTENLSWPTWQESTFNLKETLNKYHRRKQLFIDISELVQRDAKSGIQRVVCCLLSEFLKNSPSGFWIEPVYALEDKVGYYYARKFMHQFQNKQVETINDNPVEIGPGDIFFGLDLSPSVQVKQASYYNKLLNYGVPVYFMVHDLLTVLRPDWWSHCKKGQAEIKSYYERWLQVVYESSGAICVSQSTLNELEKWIDAKQIERNVIPYKTMVSHLGADFETYMFSRGLPPDAEQFISVLKKRFSFLMVGTLEPRKGHGQTLFAFEQLWDTGLDVNLIIIGKQGWMVDVLVKKINNHPELNKRLFWLESVSDEYLVRIYRASTCLIAASEGEGFGLPLIEAARYKVPIIARDIAVFREVAGEYAYYFNGLMPVDLANTLTQWLNLYAEGNIPKSGSMPWLTWRQCAENLKKVLLETN